MIDLLGGIFWSDSIYNQHTWVYALFKLVYDFLNWDVVKGGLGFILAVSVGAYMVRTIRKAMGGG